MLRNVPLDLVVAIRDTQKLTQERLNLVVQELALERSTGTLDICHSPNDLEELAEVVASVHEARAVGILEVLLNGLL